MNKFKKTIGLVLSLVLVLTISACGKGGNTTSNSENNTSSGKTKIKVANYALLEKGYTEFWESVKDGFEKEYEDVEIEWVTAPYGEILGQVMNMAGAGDKVDLIFSELIWIPALADSGLAEPLEGVLDKDFLDDFYPNILDTHSIDDTLYGLPLYVSPSILFYNKNLFEKAGLDPNSPPTTYDEMLEMAEKLAQLTTEDGNKIYPFGQPTASVPVVGASLTAFTSNFGGYLFDDNGELNVSNEGFVQAMNMLQLLDEKAYNPQNVKPKDLRNLFALEQLAMYYDNSWGFNGIKAINPDAENFTATAMPLKGGSGSGETTLQSHAFVAVNNGDSQIEAAKNFIQYVVSKEVLEDYMKDITPAFPAKKSMADVLNPVLEGSKDSTEKAVAARMFPTLNDFNLEFCSLAQAITVGNENVDSAIKTFEPSAKSILK